MAATIQDRKDRTLHPHGQAADDILSPARSVMICDGLHRLEMVGGIILGNPSDGYPGQQPGYDRVEGTQIIEKGFSNKERYRQDHQGADNDAALKHGAEPGLLPGPNKERSEYRGQNTGRRDQQRQQDPGKAGLIRNHAHGHGGNH